jgi:hypothetical protein
MDGSSASDQGFDRIQVCGAAVTRFDSLSPDFRSLRDLDV